MTCNTDHGFSITLNVTPNGQTETAQTTTGTTNSTVPVGMISYYTLPTAPDGYLECNGDMLSTADYPALFDVIGYSFGGAADQFQLPDLRAEFIRGWDNGRNIDDGRDFGSAQKGTITAFDPALSSTNVTSSIPSSDLSGNDAAHIMGLDPIDGSLYPEIHRSSIVATSHSPLDEYGFATGITRPRNIALLPCIKY